MIHKVSTRADYECIRKMDGLFVGQLDEYEMESFNRLCEDGLASRHFPDGAHALLGLPKVKVKKDFGYHEVTG